MATQDRGLGSPNMSESKKREIQSAGGKASGNSRAANASSSSSTGRTFEDRKKASEAGKKGGSH